MKRKILASILTILGLAIILLNIWLNIALPIQSINAYPDTSPSYTFDIFGIGIVGSIILLAIFLLPGIIYFKNKASSLISVAAVIHTLGIIGFFASLLMIFFGTCNMEDTGGTCLGWAFGIIFSLFSIPILILFCFVGSLLLAIDLIKRKKNIKTT